MIKEVGNLQENGTFQEINQQPWMLVIETMWVINRSLEDDGKNAPKVKAKLVVRGDQDNGEEEVSSDCPTVDRGTVKFMLALAANQGWDLRSVDISAAFLQVRNIDRSVYVKPPPEFRKH